MFLFIGAVITYTPGGRAVSWSTILPTPISLCFIRTIYSISSNPWKVKRVFWFLHFFDAINWPEGKGDFGRVNDIHLEILR